MTSLLLGLLGAALGLGLFGAGVLWGRRREKAPGRRASGTAAVKPEEKWREIWNFLSYDGSELPGGQEGGT